MKSVLIFLAVLTPHSFADSLLAQPNQAVNFVEHKPSSDELEAKEELAKPLPKTELAAELPDDQTEASDCNNCRLNPGSSTPTHAALAKIPLSAVSK